MKAPPALVETHRLRLRRFNDQDAPVVAMLAGDRSVALMTERIPHPYPAGTALAWIALLRYRMNLGQPD
ncbi:MAG: hypothetical protein O7G13_13860 [Alphaproteobacteria bacterium]|nr:hypothetical protein [Alphaproteobacteria bacterium]MCZ6846286.1 hypothetical protein [Alphaproteobacteria bacterium]